MPHIELKLGQENFPVQPQGANTITNPGVIPDGSKTAKFSFITCPSYYKGTATLYMFGDNDRETEFNIDRWGGNAEFKVEGFDKFYFGMHPLPGKDDYFSFTFHFDDGKPRERRAPSYYVQMGERARYILEDAIKSGSPVRIVPQVVYGQPWLHEYMGHTYQVASVQGEGEILQNTILLPLMDPLPVEEFDLKIENTFGVGVNYNSPDLTAPSEPGFPWIVNRKL